MGPGTREDGAGAVEYLAVVLFLAVVTGVIAASDVGAVVADKCSDALCRVTGGTCARQPAPNARPRGLPPIAATPTEDRSPPRPPIPKPTCTPDNGLPWQEGLHSHNDYQNKRPLQDALDNGATSVEADVWLDPDGKLRLRHLKGEKSPGTLRELYVEPLIELAKRNGGQIYPGRDEPFQLFIEIKEGGGAAAYQKALEELEGLPPGVNVIFGGVPPGVVPGTQPPNVSFAISDADGCTLPPEVDPSSPKYDRDYAKNFTMLNGSYDRCVDRNGDGDVSAEEQAALNKLVEQAHAAGLKVRMVEGPDGPKRNGKKPGKFKRCGKVLVFGKECGYDDQEASWRAQLEAGVDFIDTNHVARGRKFLRTCGQGG